MQRSYTWYMNYLSVEQRIALGSAECFAVQYTREAIKANEIYNKYLVSKTVPSLFRAQSEKTEPTNFTDENTVNTLLQTEQVMHAFSK